MKLGFELAVAAVEQDVLGEELYPRIFDKTAVLMRAIIADHPFMDGNKRTGMMAALVFLNLSGYSTNSIRDTELEDFAVRVAVDHLNVTAIACWLVKNSKQKRQLR